MLYSQIGSASLALEVAELHVVLAPLLLSEEGAERVELGFRGELLSSDVHLIVSAVNEVGGDHSRRAVGVCGAQEAQADVTLERVAVGAAGGDSDQLSVTVDGLAPPGPDVQLCVVILQNQHHEAPRDSLDPLPQQSVPAQEICVLRE